MSKSRKTCDKCEHYTPTNMLNSPTFANAGDCALMGDGNDMDPVNDIDRASGWDYDGYKAGVYVGPKFGCIHWLKKAES